MNVVNRGNRRPRLPVIIDSAKGVEPWQLSEVLVRTLWFLFIGLCLFGCAAEIGDDCSSDLACGQGRACDLASRGGYCTISPCEPGSCPEEAVCVIFENSESYCMRTCGGGDDCRSGYRCDRETASKPFCRANP